MKNPGSFEEKYIQSTDGLKLYYRDYSPRSTGTPILCLHGLTRNSRDFEALALHMARLGRRVLTVDFRGRGKSQYDPNHENYKPPVYVQDVLKCLGDLAISEVIVVGTSLGGLVAMVLATTKPSVLKAVILNDIGPVVDSKGVERIRGHVGKSRVFASWQEVADALRRINEPIYPDFGPDEWLTFAQRTFRENQSGQIAADYDPAIAIPFKQDENAKPDGDPWPLFDGLKSSPTLAIRGVSSDILSAETLAKMKQIKPDLETLVVEGRGHAPLLTEPECLQAIDEFLAQHP